MKRTVVALGSNLGDRLSNLAAAAEALAALPHTAVVARSRVYETDPVGYRDQPRFLNAALLLETDLSPRALLGGCLGIEAALGRRRSFPNAPRVIDLDLLWMEGERSDDPELTLPHPRMTGRAFVMIPVADLPQTGLPPADFPVADRAGVRFFAAFPAPKNQDT